MTTRQKLELMKALDNRNEDRIAEYLKAEAAGKESGAA